MSVIQTTVVAHTLALITLVLLLVLVLVVIIFQVTLKLVLTPTNATQTMVDVVLIPVSIQLDPFCAVLLIISYLLMENLVLIVTNAKANAAQP